MRPVALTIAGSDPSGGAGMQADLKTFCAFGVNGAAVVTALTAQNSRGVQAVQLVAPEFVAAQLDSVLADLTISAVKTGMLGGAAAVDVIVRALGAHTPVALVVDPVLIAGGGEPLAEPDLLPALRAHLLPRASLVTPNLAEAGALLDRVVEDLPAMHAAARALVELGAGAALVTGGHLEGPPIDVLYDGKRTYEVSGTRVALLATHGTGCALSAAITAGLARGRPLVDAVRDAKGYLERALAAVAGSAGRRPSPDHLMRPPGD